MRPVRKGMRERVTRRMKAAGEREPEIIKVQVSEINKHYILDEGEEYL